MDMQSLLDAFHDYENTHNVKEYRYNNIHVWPMLKVDTFFYYFNKTTLSLGEKDSVQKAGSKSGIFHKINTLIKLANGNIAAFNTNYKSLREISKSGRNKILVLTSRSREMVIDGNKYNYVVDPVVELFENNNCEVLRCYTDDVEINQNDTKLNLFYMINAYDLLSKYYLYRSRKLAPPPWFKELDEYAGMHDLQRFSWSYYRKRLIFQKLFSKWFERFIKTHGFKAIVVDTWYSPYAQAASIAAKRCGIPTMDLQHGSQHAEHVAYSQWHNPEDTRMEIIPDVFLVWGGENRDNLLNRNQNLVPSDNVYLVGNAWLNKWRANLIPESVSKFKQASELRSGYRKVHLITLQHRVPYEDQVKAFIKSCGNDTLWLIRLHRSMELTIDDVERQFAEFDNVNVREATEIPLYTLFNVSDIHYTWYSTCAVEALAFGLTSILMSEESRERYREYVDEGVMIICEDPEDHASVLEKALAVPKSEPLRVAECSFAGSESSEKAIKELCHRIETWPQKA